MNLIVVGYIIGSGYIFPTTGNVGSLAHEQVAACTDGGEGNRQVRSAGGRHVDSDGHVHHWRFGWYDTG